MILPAGAGRLHNNWNIYETDMFNWRASFPVPVDAQVLHAWQQALFVAGERHGILRFEQADQIGYDRARDGFIGDFAAAHPDRPAQYADYPVGFILQHWNQLTVATRLAYVVGEDWHQPGDRIEESWCSSVGDLSFYAKVPGEDTGAPIDIYTDVDERTSPCRLYVEVSSKTDIFFRATAVSADLASSRLTTGCWPSAMAGASTPSSPTFGLPRWPRTVDGKHWGHRKPSCGSSTSSASRCERR
ncbi:hypothetical protein [Dactylosporangium darangshiense]|uniref:hypothetical protein n=1 Tax=Dactylosporangium darangshiense TaxID=579108 RepID=UPI0036285528